MYSISIKGIVLGSLFDLVVSFVFGIVLIVVLTVSNDGNPDVAMAAMNSGGWFAFQMVVGFALTVIAGYLAAWIAGRGEMINGTLSAVFTITIMIPMMAGQPMPWSMTIMVILYILTPLFGLLGGYLRSRQVNRG